ncbi:MAG: 50S ribosomal protein L15 [Patescibacteria group bacterium]
MQLHHLKPTLKKRRIKRIGRGGKRGTYSGRGMKGQRARAGRKIRPAERDLFQRLPKLRGFKHKSLKEKALVFNVEDLAKKFKEGTINKKMLLELGLIKKVSVPVKILGNGEIKKSFKIRGLAVSKSAKEKIEKAGGSVI